MRAILIKPLKALAYTALGACFAVLIGGIWILESRPDLDVWHTAELDEEFTADSDIDTFAEYLQLEDRLFEQLEAVVYDHAEPGVRHVAMRYRRGSKADPDRWPRNWNRSFELTTPEPRAGVLLLHGMSDSPYSLRAIGERLHANGAAVVALRLPGHGTAPSGLLGLRNRDLMAAVRLGVRHTHQLAGDRPIYLVGYSTGGALAVDYALAALEDEDLPGIAGIVLISPAIGVSAAAAFAVWQARVGHLLGLRKLEWNVLAPEYDPFKYGAFAVNAADLVYRMTAGIRASIDRLGPAGKLDRLPPILAFQSIVDATVSTPALIDGLLALLPARGDELILFDIDRSDRIEPFLARDPSLDIKTALGEGGLPFAVSVVTNEHPGTEAVVIKRQPAGSSVRSVTPLHQSWPPDVVSLSHNALPVPPSDELYGAVGSGNPESLHLGNLSMRGERGLLTISPEAQLRLRWNPFFDYLERRTLEFMNLE